MTPRVRIIVTLYASGAHAQACLDALAAQTSPDFEVVVVDNGGTEDGEPHRLALPDGRFSHIVSPTNDGFSGGFVRGAEGASAPWLMSVNPDTVLDPDGLERLLAAAEAQGRPAMVSPILFRDDSRTVLDGAGDSLSAFGIPWRNGYGWPADTLPERALSEVFAPTGAAALYRRDAYEAAGGFDPAFFCYLEDVDLALRLRALGGRCLLVHDATGRHAGGHSTAALPGFAIRHTARNGGLLLQSLPGPLRAVVRPLYHVGQAALLRRGRRSVREGDVEAAGYRAAGLAEARALKNAARAKRRARPRYPLGASLAIGRRLAWSLRGVRTHAPRLWEWEKSH